MNGIDCHITPTNVPGKTLSNILNIFEVRSKGVLAVEINLAKPYGAKYREILRNIELVKL